MKPLLITQPRVGRSHYEILALQMAAEELGWEVHPAETSWRLSEEMITSGKKGIPYGSQIFCEVIADQMGWQLKKLPFHWLAALSREYTKRLVSYQQLKYAKLIQERTFIKPADDKCFDAKIYEPGTFEPSSLIEDTYPTLASEPVDFTHEYRFFISYKDGKPNIETWSAYILNKKILEDDKMAQMIPANGYAVDRWLDIHLKFMKITCPTVIDVGYLAPDNLCAVIESNPIWASGLYYCDPVAVMKAIEGCI